MECSRPEYIVPHSNFWSFPGTNNNMFLDAVMMRMVETLYFPGVLQFHPLDGADFPLQLRPGTEDRESCLLHRGEWRQCSNWKEDLGNCHLCHLGAFHRSAVLYLNIRLPNNISKKFIPRTFYTMDPFAKELSGSMGPGPVSSLHLESSERGKENENSKIETKPTWKILEPEERTIHPLPMFSPPQQHQEPGSDGYSRRS